MLTLKAYYRHTRLRRQKKKKSNERDRNRMTEFQLPFRDATLPVMYELSHEFEHGCRAGWDVIP